MALLRGPEARYDAAHPKADDVLLIATIQELRVFDHTGNEWPMAA